MLGQLDSFVNFFFVFQHLETFFNYRFFFMVGQRSISYERVFIHQLVYFKLLEFSAYLNLLRLLSFEPSSSLGHKFFLAIFVQSLLTLLSLLEFPMEGFFSFCVKIYSVIFKKATRFQRFSRFHLKLSNLVHVFLNFKFSQNLAKRPLFFFLELDQVENILILNPVKDDQENEVGFLIIHEPRI